jgi:enoyl-CoA hydratase
MTFTNLQLTNEDQIATIAIDRPSKLNALNNETFDELKHALNNCLEDKDISAILITGSGEKAFVAGADIAELNKASADEGYQISKKGQDVFNILMNSEKPVIAAVNGFALGGGCELAMACHFRYASENAKFGQPEVNLGLIPGYSGTQRLTRLVGKGKALELLLTADIIDANEAKEIGLVNKVFPAEQLITEAKKCLRKIIAKAPLAVKYCLEAVNKGEEMSLIEAETLEASFFGLVHASEDAKEGCNAFLSKRKPEFKGR